MARVEKMVQAIRQNQKNVKFADLARICDHYFGEPRQREPVTWYIKRLGLEIHG